MKAAGQDKAKPARKRPGQRQNHQTHKRILGSHNSWTAGLCASVLYNPLPNLCRPQTEAGHSAISKPLSLTTVGVGCNAKLETPTFVPTAMSGTMPSFLVSRERGRSGVSTLLPSIPRPPRWQLPAPEACGPPTTDSWIKWSCCCRRN